MQDGDAFPSTLPSHRSRRIQQIHIDEIEFGNDVLIPHGSIPLADGSIVGGTTTMDKSSLTSESVPIPNLLVINSSPGRRTSPARSLIRVTNLGNKTALQQIVHAVGESLNCKAPIEDLADLIYVSLVVLIIWLAIS